MLLSINIAGLSFAGADVGGFFGNVDAELITRWMQAAAYQPFYRGHAHHDSARREPWLFGDETLSRLRRAAMARYALLPYWYTVFQNAHLGELPVMRPMWMQYPKNVDVVDIDHQWLVGSDLLVCPVVKKGHNNVPVFFPNEDLWYDVDTFLKVDEAISGKFVTIDANIDKVPVYQRGGSIIPRKLRLRRSSKMMEKDPYTLYIALDKDGKAEGTLYIDDEHTFDYTRGMYIKRRFVLEGGILKNLDTAAGEKAASSVVATSSSSAYDVVNEIERLVVMGVATKPNKITSGGRNLEFNYDEATGVVVVRKPELKVSVVWQVEFDM
jgi:alpha 1,3-glucosidase